MYRPTRYGRLTEHLHHTVAEAHATDHLYHSPDGDPLEDSGWKRLAALCEMVTTSPPRDWRNYRAEYLRALADCVKGDRNTDWVARQGMAAVIRQSEDARATWEEIQAAGGVVSAASAA